MKRFYAVLIGTIFISSIYGASLPVDSVAEDGDSISLGEVTVTASPVVRKVDRDVYVPSETIKGTSSDGLSLLSKVQIPSLFVNEVMEKITAGGDDVELRINGRVSTIRDVKAIDPQTVVRVEYLDNPGLRYNGAAAVINIIVRNPTSGGSLMANALSSIPKPLYNGFLNLRINHGRSQWGLRCFGNKFINTSMTSRTQRRYELRSGEIERTEEPLDGSWGYSWIYAGVYYNYLVPEKTNIYVNAQLGVNPNERNFNRGLLSGTGIENVVSTTSTDRTAQYPSLSFYIDQRLRGNQILVLNTEIGWRRERSTRMYNEIPEGVEIPTVDINTRTRVHNFDFSAEANYIKEWSKVSLTSGVKYYAAWSATDYAVPIDRKVKQRQGSLYGFAELTARLGSKVNLTGGFGGEYAYSSPGASESYNEFIWRPRFSASYRASDVSRFRVTLTSWSTNPSLTELSDVVTEVDGFQLSTGNPNLKSYANYQVWASYMFTHPRIQAEVKAGWFRAPNAIAEYYCQTPEDEGDYIMSTYANQSRTRWEIKVAPRVTVVKNWLTISGSLNFRRYYMRGPGYRNIATSWSGNYEVNATHWGFTLSGQGYFSPYYLSGQNYSRGEVIHILSLGYRYKNLNVTAGVFCPYSTYKQYNGVTSPAMTSRTDTEMRKVSHMPFIQLSYNLKWGKQKEESRRLIDATDTSSKGKSGL